MLGTAACVSPAWASGTGRPLVAHLEPAETLRVQLVDPDLLERMHDDVARDAADPGHLHRADVDVPDAVALQVDEGIGNPERHLVPKLGRAKRVADDQDVGHRLDPIARASLAIQGSRP